MTTKVETAIGVIWAFFVRLAVLVGLAYTLYRVRSILLAVIFSVMLTYVILPVVDSVCRIHVKGWSCRSRRFWASFLVFAVLVAITGVAVQYIVAPFVREARDVITDASSKQGFETFSKRTHWLDRLPPDLRSLIGENEKKDAWNASKKWMTGVVGSTIAWAKNFLDIILIPVLAFYFALDYRSLRREFVGALPKRRRREAMYLLRHIGQILQSYIVGQIILCVTAGVVIGLVLWALEMDHVLALGVFAGITRAIPVIGPIISGIVIVIIGTMKSLQLGMFLLGVFCVVHLVESKLILPKLIGDRMRLHPAVVIIVLLIGSEFFGIAGMFLAAPVAAIIRELVRFYIINPRSKRENDEPESDSEVVELPPPSLRAQGM